MPLFHKGKAARSDDPQARKPALTRRFFAWGGMYPSETEPPLQTTDGTRCGPVWRAAKLCLEAKMKKQLTIGLLAALTLTSPVWAEEVDEIVVSATGIPTPISQIGASVDVISAEDLEKPANHLFAGCAETERN